MAMRALGHSTETAANGAEALRRLGERAFDLVLLDIVMPEMDGYAVLEALKADDELRDIPVIVISSLDDEIDSVVRAIKLGAVDFLPKDFEPEILKARLDSSLARKRFRDRELEYFRDVEQLTRAAQVAYSQTLAGIAWGMLLLGEKLPPVAWGAFGLVVLGFWLVQPKQAGDEFSVTVPINRA